MAALVISAYQPGWPAQYLQAAAEIQAALGGREMPLEHIGSTAVPGLCAKPVLDILLGAESLDDVMRQAGGLAALGYAYRPEYEAVLPARRYFVRPAGALPRVHLHAVPRGGALWRAHLHCRDRLRQDGDARQRYATLKHELARRHGDDKAAYTDAKAPFLQALLADMPLP